MPELSGLDVCRLLRNKYNYQGGIIFVTAKGELDDCVRALNTGADDFVVKPYKIKELSARLNAVLRRKDKPFIDKIYQKGNIEINASLCTVQCDDTKIQLRKKEFALFEMLFVNLNNVLPRTSIFEKIWEDKMDTNMESLDSHIYMLRKSLKVFPNIQIKSIKNIGYKMEIMQ
ncbi:MAG: response regulator transcription factor [Alphaproteobacteria bacterium]|nr:response regulator transcription factor [Alphaproteobacteria bacterium]